jgi:hypothetical protein
MRVSSVNADSHGVSAEDGPNVADIDVVLDEAYGEWVKLKSGSAGEAGPQLENPKKLSHSQIKNIVSEMRDDERLDFSGFLVARKMEKSSDALVGYAGSRMLSALRRNAMRYGVE